MYKVSDIINILKYPCMDSMKKYGILSSLLLAISIMNNKDNKNAETFIGICRNPFFINKLDGYSSVEIDNKDYAIFKDINEGISRFIDKIKSEDYEQSYIFNNYDIEESILAYSNGDDNIEKELLRIVDCYELKQYDENVLRRKYQGNKTYVGIDLKKGEDLFINLYSVKKSFDDNYSIYTSTDIDKAIQQCTLPNYNVYDANGNVVYTKSNKPTLQEKIKTKAFPINIRAGMIISLSNINLYNTATDSTPIRSVTGNFYLYDGKEYNERYRICKDISKVNKDPMAIIGYIHKKYIK